MTKEEIRLAVRTTLAVLTRITKRTRTQADDLMASILRSNEERIVEAVSLLDDGTGKEPTEADIVKALDSVGIKV